MRSAPVLLVGDVGGTKTVIALYEAVGGDLRPGRDAVFESGSHGGLEEILEQFLPKGEAEGVDAACFGVAGPVVDGRVRATNLPWRIDARELSRRCGLARVALLNDLEAMAHGMLELGPGEREVLQPGAEPGRPGHVAVIAAGTGLGQAMLVWDGGRHRALASEGGHVDFAPRDDVEIGLLRFLRDELGGRVSVERVLSGPGLHNIYRFLRREVGEPEPAWLAERMREGDPSAVIGAVGLEERDPVCARALERFVSIYGSEAGNLALRCVALGGVMLGGGIAPKVLPALRSRRFLESFADKGRFAGMLRGIEVSVALDPRAPLRGAARVASRLSG